MNDNQRSGKSLEADDDAVVDVDVVEEAEVGRLSLNDMPDEILIQIFNRLIDLKCLCSCSLVSPRFSSLILLHVHSVSFSVPRRHHQSPNPTPDNPSTVTFSRKLLRFFVAKPLHYLRQIASPKPLPSMISSFYGDSFRSAIYFLTKFKSIRSLHLLLPSSSSPHNRNPNPNDDESLFKWTAKFGPTIDTFVFLCPSSIVRIETEFDSDELQQEQGDDYEMLKHRVHLAFQCLKDAIVRHRMLLFFVEEHPLLENITITDSKNQGSLSLRDSKIVEIRNWINSASLPAKSELKRIEVPVNAHQWHVPVLELPVSRKVMVNATLVLMEMVDRRHQRRDWGGDAAAIAQLFELGDEAFGEAVVEMMVNHKSRIKILL